MRRLTRLPIAHNEHDKRNSFARLEERYAAMEKEPLLVTAHLATPFVPADAQGSLHLDAILSWAVLHAHRTGVIMESREYTVPLPLELAWLSPNGLPLWASGDLQPDIATPGAEYFHKRYPGHRADWSRKESAVTTAGRYKEYRVPLGTLRTGTVSAIAIGNRAEVERLLGYVSHIGRKGSMGYGRVLRWTAEPHDASIEHILDTRPVPCDYYAGREPRGVYVPRRGWTPPYWYVPWHSPCMVPR